MNKVLTMTVALVATMSVHSSDLSGEWFEASREGNIKVVEAILSSSPEFLKLKNEKGYTAFILSSYHNHRNLSRLLIKKGADPCEVDSRGNNALMGVLFKGHEELIADLIDKCDVNHANTEGQTPLMYASLFGREEAVKKLISLGARRDMQDRNGRTALSLAEGQWNQAMVSLLKTFRIIQ